MARKLRVQYPGAVYHVMNRGDWREDTFKSDNDRWLFLETLGQAIEKPVERGWFGELRVWSLRSKVRRSGKGSTVDLPQEGLALGRRWHVRDGCLHARSGGHAGRVAG